MDKLCVLCIILQCLLVEIASDEGSVCTSYGTPGICSRVRNCPTAIDSLKQSHTTGLKRCGFIGKDELVCCPSNVKSSFGDDDDNYTSSEEDPDSNSVGNQNRFIKRKCEQACEEISNEVKSKVDFHIIGGVDAGSGEFPHMAALGYETDEGISWDCSGSVISNRFLLSAAHCMANVRRLLPKIARLGVTSLNEKNAQDYPIKNITVNPQYNSLTKHNDIALVEVARVIVYSDKIIPACLYFENNDPLGLMVTGWGKTSVNSNDDRSNTLQKALLVPESLDKCNISYITKSSGSRTIAQTQICAGSNTSDACWGDSGGPLQIQNVAGSYSIVGIVSYGAGCGGRLPGVYTRVSRYLDWIEKIVWP